MIQIRTGTSWRDDPRVASALGRVPQAARAAAARAVADALAIEVDGVDLAAGRAEAPLLPSLEALLRALSRLLSGASQVAVALGDGGIELVVRRRGPSALLTVVELGRPSHVLARDVEVELEALAAAALDAAANFCCELGALLPPGAREDRELRAAVRDLRRAEPAPLRPPSGAVPTEPPPGAAPSVSPVASSTPDAARSAVSVEVDDPDGVLTAYEGGRPDLGSLLFPGRLLLRDAEGVVALELPGFPFLSLRDLVAAADRVLSAVRRGERSTELGVSRQRRGSVVTLRLDLAGGGSAVVDPAAAAGRTGTSVRSLGWAPLALLRAVCTAALDLGRLARAHNPRQAENAYLAELEAAAAERLAELDELERGDVPAAAPGAAAIPPVPPVARAPLGPGELRRLSFRRAGLLEVGPPAGEGLLLSAERLVAAGQHAIAALDRRTGERAWRAPGGRFAAFLPGAALAATDERLFAVALTSGRVRWERSLPGAPPGGAAALQRGPWLAVEPGAVTAVDPATGSTRWRVTPPGASRLRACAFGGLVVVAADTGFVYALDAAGRTVWRVRAPGPVVAGPQPGAGSCLVSAEAGAGTVVLAIDPATGLRRWEATLELSPAGPIALWGTRLAVPGTVGGDAAVAVVERSGRVAWTEQPPLSGPPRLASTGPLLVVQDRAGALVALDRSGASVWTRPAGHAGPAAAPPRAARGTVVLAGENVTCLDAERGEIVGAIPGAAAARLAVDAELSVAALDLDGQATLWRLGGHLSVV